MVKPSNHRKNWNETDFANLVKFINASGYTSEEVSQKLKRTVGSVTSQKDLLNLYGNTIRTRNKDKNWEASSTFLKNIEEISLMIIKLKSDSEIASEFNLNKHTFKKLKRKFLSEYMVKRQPSKGKRLKLTEKTVEKVFNAYYDDLSIKEIAVKLGMKYHQVCYVLYGTSSKKVGVLREKVEKKLFAS